MKYDASIPIQDRFQTMSAGIERLFTEGEITALGRNEVPHYDQVPIYSIYLQQFLNTVLEKKNKRRSNFGNESLF